MEYMDPCWLINYVKCQCSLEDRSTTVGFDKPRLSTGLFILDTGETQIRPGNVM